MASVHIGKKIKEVLSKSPMSVVDFAEKINKTRTVAYDIFKRDSVDSVLLNKISKVLNHNFFQYYPVEKVREEKGVYFPANAVIEQLTAELKETKKEVEELKKQNELLQKIVSLMEKNTTPQSYSKKTKK